MEDWTSLGQHKRKPEFPIITRESLRNSRKTTGAYKVQLDSAVVADGTLSIEYTLSTGSGGANADNFGLYFIAPAKGVDYAVLATALEAELKTKLDSRATFVNAPVAAGARVEYYTVGGMKIDAPKAGEVIIRKTTKNGKVVVDKILVK